MIFIYLFATFLAFYFSYKKYSREMESRDSYDDLVYTQAFWKIVGITITWPIFVPLALMWKLLDYFFYKLTKQK